MLKAKGISRCIFCQKEVKQFDYHGKEFPILFLLGVVGAGKRRMKCPHCASKDRERLIYHYLAEQKLIPDEEDFSLLHIAPEKNLGKELQKKKIRYVTGDINKEKADFFVDVQDMPFADKEFDAIICSHVIEHIENDEQGLRELHRVIKSGGWAILQVPYARNLKYTIENKKITSPQDRELYFGQYNHLRIYSEEDYLASLEKAGFEVAPHAYNKEEEISFVQENCVDPEEKVFFCRKK